MCRRFNSAPRHHYFNNLQPPQFLKTGDFARDFARQLRESQRRKHFEYREVIYSKAEMDRTLGVSRQSIYRYMEQYPQFPGLYTFKWDLRRWAEKYGIPRKPGPPAGYRRRQVAA